MDSHSNKCIQLFWPKIKEIVVAFGRYDVFLDPLGEFDWSMIGLKRIESELNYAWHFEIVDAKKLSYAMIKYNFNL
jgi:hypothetical protein